MLTVLMVLFVPVGAGGVGGAAGAAGRSDKHDDCRCRDDHQSHECKRRVCDQEPDMTRVLTKIIMKTNVTVMFP